ncbi:MAG: hypothetical protein C0618_04300 [Desulfuromonas sp.]|nr:MAG: hypothetical protein C0618_04300 [Desulfuromonas sp.]
MSELIKWLKAFNAKERYFLLAYVQDQDALQLGPFFRGQLSQKLGVMVPKDAFVAMDYHLDWLYAALHVAVYGPEGSGPGGSHENVLEKVAGEQKQKRMIQGQQEDADLLIAFDLDGVTHLILIEAKGVTSWGNTQMRSKALRLKQIFHDDGGRWENVKPYFLMNSPTEPPYRHDGKTKGIVLKGYPKWMLAENGKLSFLPMTNLHRESLKRVTRTEKSDAEGKEEWKKWKITSR